MKALMSKCRTQNIRNSMVKERGGGSVLLAGGRSVERKRANI